MSLADDYTAQCGQTLPILSDSSFLPSIHREITSSNGRQWHHDGIYSLVRFTWAMTLAFLRSQPLAESGLNAEQNQVTIGSSW